jgi:ribosome-binding protein aMBF1 (putative translation factor)
MDSSRKKAEGETMRENTVAINHSVPYSGAMITGSQIRAARALLGWTTQHLANQSGIHFATISRIEQTDGTPATRTSTLQSLQAALERGGVIFLESGSTRDGGPGVRLSS